MVGYDKIIKSLWTGKCTVEIKSPKKNEKTGRTDQEDEILFADEPCRISFASKKSTAPADDAAVVPQTIKLFIDKEKIIPPGSKITVTQNGKTQAYSRSGEPAVYSVHQEIALELFKGYA